MIYLACVVAAFVALVVASAMTPETQTQRPYSRWMKGSKEEEM